jgi:twitching motility protein PilJ
VARESSQTRGRVTELAEAAQRQTEQIVAAAGRTQEMSRSMQEMSEGARQSAEVANASVSVAKRGADAVRKTITGMNDMREQIQETAKRIKRLGESSQQISEIVNLIDDIAEQTNILSLNASIQAAQAGEAGRGFAVVADEVQRLAERSAEATRQIDTLVKTIQADTNDAVVAMEKATQEVVEGASVADAAGQALGEIEEESEALSRLIADMAQSALSQSENATGVSASMDEIRQVTEQTSRGTRDTAGAIAHLSELVQDLQTSVAGFRLE